MSYRKRDKSSLKDEVSSTVTSINCSQVTAASSNMINMASLAEDLTPDSFVKSRGTNLSLNEPLVKHDAEPELLSECTRFSRGVKGNKPEKE